MMTSPLPTRIDLLQGGIVTLDHQHKKVITNTIQVAHHFDKRPSNVNQRITSLVKRDRLKIKPMYYLDQQGREQKYHELNRDQFLLVVMGFTGDKADQFKADFITLFNHVEGERDYWMQQRHLASDNTKLANDNIFWLKTALAKEIPSSMRCIRLFNHIQDAINIAVTGSAKTNRADMTAYQLYQLGQLEQMVHAEIERLRLDGVAPQQIRDDVLTMIRTAKEKAQTAAKPKRTFYNAIQ